MSEQTKIAWCDSTVNFWSGCTKVSAGCQHCYAETRDKRHMIEKVNHWGNGAPRLKHVGAVKQAHALNRKPWICPICNHAMTDDESKSYLGCPNGAAQKQWLESDRLSPMPPPRVMHVAQHHRRRIFSLSLGDWLDEEVPIEWLAEMLDTIRQCDQVTWILCTKRAENFFSRIGKVGGIYNPATTRHEMAGFCENWMAGTPPKNIILLASVENQAAADERIPALMKIPAACRGLSLEPLLGPVDVRRFLLSVYDKACHDNQFIEPIGGHSHEKINWCIVGGESGPGARPCNMDWIREIRMDCQDYGCALFVKQAGANPVAGPSGIRMETRDKKGGDISELPDDLRVREFPEQKN